MPASHMASLLLVFPPQWSPFQPALSLPSLAAWLRRAGHDVETLDLNLHFYEFLLSDACADLLLERVEASGWTSDVRRAFRATFEHVADFRADLSRLRELTANPSDPEEYVRVHYRAVKSFETYLDAVSQVCERFTVSPYEFRLAAGNLEASELEYQIGSPPSLLKEFVRDAVEREILPRCPGMIGLSCIGQDQLYLSLLLGAELKRRERAIPIVVGGTILARIYERGALKPTWFDRFFDIIVRNEGEKPAERLLANAAADRPLTEDVPGIVHCEDGELVASRPCPPLMPAEIPVPDFDDMPLGRYVSAEITLPLLSSRGCYWGKCEFCHHHMVYGEKYGAYGIDTVLEAVQTLAQRYGVRHFAFNDEAIPPKIMRAMGQRFPPHETSGWSFTGLIKFEKYFKREDFENLHGVGFRSLYVGLESASERVLALMRKNNKKETMIRNLADATGSGIWMHCFLFFGFPGETEAEAQETYDFVLTHSDIISSFGSATFVLEHNAPIFHHVDDFGVSLIPGSEDNVDVYYRFAASEGISPERALEWMERVNEAALDIPTYNAAGWVPRELQLCMLSRMGRQDLVRFGLAIREHRGLPRRAMLPEAVSWDLDERAPTRGMLVNRLNGRVLSLSGTAARLADICYAAQVELEEIAQHARPLFDELGWPDQRLSSEAASSPVPAPL